MFEQIEETFQEIIRYGILALEAVGTIVILFFAVRSLIALLKKDLKRRHHEMATGITTGLSFMLGSEVLNTLIHHGWSNIGMTCAILLMRAGITVLIHWENKHENEMGKE